MYFELTESYFKSSFFCTYFVNLFAGFDDLKNFILSNNGINLKLLRGILYLTGVFYKIDLISRSFIRSTAHTRTEDITKTFVVVRVMMSWREFMEIIHLVQAKKLLKKLVRWILRFAELTLFLATRKSGSPTFATHKFPVTRALRWKKNKFSGSAASLDPHVFVC